MLIARTAVCALYLSLVALPPCGAAPPNVAAPTVVLASPLPSYETDLRTLTQARIFGFSGYGINGDRPPAALAFERIVARLIVADLRREWSGASPAGKLWLLCAKVRNDGEDSPETAAALTVGSGERALIAFSAHLHFRDAKVVATELKDFPECNPKYGMPEAPPAAQISRAKSLK